MSGFNANDYLDDLPDAGDAAPHDAAADASASAAPESPQGKPSKPSEASDAGAEQAAHADAGSDDHADGQPKQQQGPSDADGADAHGDASKETLTPLGQAKKEAAEYLDALQRERAEFVNFRNRSKKEQERFREHGITDVLTTLLPALDDIDRIRAHSELDDSFNAVAAKIDKAFAKFGVEKFGEPGEEFDPTKHEAVLHKPAPEATKETVDTVVEAGYRVGDRVIRAARVVVASPKN